MVAILKKELGLTKTLNEIPQISSINIFEQVPAAELLATQTEQILLSWDQLDLQKSFIFNDL
jgi:hypothetical protein